MPLGAGPRVEVGSVQHVESTEALVAAPMHIERLPHSLSPGEAFEAFCRLPDAFFLDSGLPGRRLGRFSFLGAEPVAALSCKGRSVRLREPCGERHWRENPFRALRKFLGRCTLPQIQSPVPFVGGLVGYLGYDLCHSIERLPRTAIDDIGLPDLRFGLYDRVAAYDHAAGQWYAASASGPEGVAWLRGRLDAASPHLRFAERPAAAEAPRSNFTRADYLAAVRTAKDYIAAGDIFQVNLSQRFETTIAVPPVELYRRLRRANPAPFAAYLALNDHDAAILSSSPERFLKVVERRVETRPIKGTRRRGETPAEDETLAAQLLASEKDAAELTMIVDLERNDLGRVCDYGSVRVAEHKVLEAYASVFHLVSTVEGRLHEARDAVDLLKATFPGGSITGAPKVRAMEIIDELEPTQRGVYTGAIGYIGLDGTLDLNIAIRTMIVTGSRALFQVGGGIVADSEPAAEFQETLDKGQRLFQALGQSQPVC